MRLDQILHEIAELVEKTTAEGADALSTALDRALQDARDEIAIANPPPQLTPAEIAEIEERDEARAREEAELTEEKIQAASLARRGLDLQDAKAFFDDLPEFLEDDDARAQADVLVRWAQEPGGGPISVAGHPDPSDPQDGVVARPATGETGHEEGGA